jgi:hypothetical protein
MMTSSELMERFLLEMIWEEFKAPEGWRTPETLARVKEHRILGEVLERGD